MLTRPLLPLSFDLAVQAVELVKQRLRRATAALESAQVPYAVAGGNAVAVWIARVDREAVGTTQDVDILIRRGDFERARAALENAGFLYRHLRGVDVFLDGPTGRPRSGVHLIFASEKVRESEAAANPDPSQSELAEENFRVLNLEAIVQIKLTAFREKDQEHLRDFIDLGMVDDSWPAKYPGPLADRLRNLLGER